jgi:4-carboxymuconolactone decarboxylase
LLKYQTKLEESPMARLPFDPSALDAADRALYDGMAARRKAQGAPFDGPYAALMNHPQLCARVEELGFYLKFQGHLPREIYQFVVLSVAKQTGSDFEWADHVAHARAAGIPEEVIGRLQSSGVAAGAFPAPYDLAAEVLAHTLSWQDVPQPVQDAAIAAYGVKGFIEVVVTSGFYQMFSAINQGFDVALSDRTPRPS